MYPETTPQPIEANGNNPSGYMAPVTDNNILQSSDSMDLIMQSSSSLNCVSEREIKLSKRRWFVLAAFSIFGLTIALTDITSPILVLFLKLIDLDIKQYLYLQPLFYYVMMALAFPTALFVDKFGIKIAMRTSAGLFVLHGFLRAIMFSPSLPYHQILKLPCYIASSLVGVEMLTLFFLLPLKVSETWFSASERTVAWSFMSSQLNLGICFASFIYPRIITKIDDFNILAYINIICVLITALSCTILVTQSEPQHPPNERVAKANRETPKSFRQSIIKMIKHRDIVVHLVHLAILESISLCISSVIQPILKSIGYNEIFSGNLLSLNSFITIIMQIFLSIFVDKMKNPILICKLGSFMHGMLFVVYLCTIIKPQSSLILIGCSIIVTICKSWLAPNFTNMTAHLACGTVSQATVVGLSMFLTVSVMTVINLIFTKLISITNHDVGDYRQSLIFLSILSIINEFFYLGFFYGQPAEQQDQDTNQRRISDRASGVQGS